MHYINTKFGFVQDIYPGEDKDGYPVLKVRHCIDVREAMPFENRGEAEKAYRRTTMASWWYAVLSSVDEEIDHGYSN